MVDQKIRDLSAASSLANTDIIEVTVDPGGSPASKKATLLLLKNSILPAGTNGGVLAYAAGNWASTAAGTAGFVLTSNGASAATWGSIVFPLTQRATDTATTAVTTCATATHDLSSGVGAAGIGVRVDWRACNGAGDIASLAALDAVAVDVSADAERGVVDVMLAAGLGALTARSARFWPSGIALGGATAAVASDAGVSLSWSSRSIVVRDSGNTSWLDVWRVDGSSRWVFGSSDATNSGGVVLLAPASGADIALRRGSTDHVAINSTGALTLGTTTHTTTLRGSALTIGLTSVVAVYQGGARVPEATVSATTTLDASHEVVFVDSTAGAVTLTLPAGAAGRVIAIQRVAGANNVIVQRAASPDTIRAASTGGLTSWTINDDARHGLIFRSANTEWVAEA